MKTKIFLLVLFLPILCFSQNYSKMVKPNSHYNYFTIYPFPPNTYDYTVFYKFSDTVMIDTLSCMKLMSSTDTSLTTWDFTGAYFYEDTINKKVYLHDGDTLGLIYDFSVDVGDTVFVYNPIEGGEMTMDFIVESIDSVFYDGKYHKAISLNHDYWIEGIGSHYGLLHPGSELVGLTRELVCFYIDMQFQYKNPDYSSCFYSGVGVDEKEQQTFFCEIRGGRVSVSSESKIDAIIVSNALGQIVKKVSVNDFQTSFDMSFLQNNLLFITCYFSNQTVLTKTVIPFEY
ncbi:MAG: hypothetical protein GX259_05790 [Bacteroidales bacterium]|nr:hypothetical protein [Bacteroidales bacterium]